MLRQRTWSLTLTLALALAACATPAPEDSRTPGRAVEPEALLQADRDFARAFAERGIDGWVSFFDQKGIQMPGGMPTAWGREEVEKTSRELFGRPNFTALTWEPLYAVVADAGDLGYTLGNYVAKGLDEKGEKITQEGNYITIWRRQEDGSWKVAFDTGNPGPPLQVPPGWR